jgi:hypothetical protein
VCERGLAAVLNTVVILETLHHNRTGREEHETVRTEGSEVGLESFIYDR